MKAEERETQLQIRCLVSNLYDLQKMRIAVGNRVVQSFYIQMGIEPGSKKDSGDEESLAMIQKLKKEYDKVTDLMIENKFSISVLRLSRFSTAILRIGQNTRNCPYNNTPPKEN